MIKRNTINIINFLESKNHTDSSVLVQPIISDFFFTLCSTSLFSGKTKIRRLKYRIHLFFRAFLKRRKKQLTKLSFNKYNFFLKKPTNLQKIKKLIVLKNNFKPLFSKKKFNIFTEISRIDHLFLLNNQSDYLFNRNAAKLDELSAMLLFKQKNPTKQVIFDLSSFYTTFSINYSYSVKDNQIINNQPKIFSNTNMFYNYITLLLI